MLLCHLSTLRWGNAPKRLKAKSKAGAKMAIYRLEKKSISRGNGHNLAAAIGYRAGLKITDHNPKNTDRKTHDYSKKSDVAHSEIILTDELKQAGVQLDFEQIANLVEQGETTKRGKMKKTAKLASEYVLAGSHELSLDENIKAFREFAEQQSREQGVIAMVFVHDPKLGNDARASKDAGDSTRTHDERNIHAHVVLLSRQVDLNAGRLELGDKSDSELSDTDRAKKGLPPSRTWLKGVRESWANIQNKSLERHNLAPVTHKSYKDLGLDIKPGGHLGKHASALLRKKREEQAERTRELFNSRSFRRADDINLLKQHRYIFKFETAEVPLSLINKELQHENKSRIKSTADSIIARNNRESASDYRAYERSFELSRDTYSFIEKANSFIAERATAPATATSTARAREQLITRRVRAVRRANRELERATNTLERNLSIVASRLAWRKEHHSKYDERQMQELDAFYKTLNVRDFTLENNKPYVSPGEWGKHVLERLTVDDILENPQIFKIVANPEQERLDYSSKSLKFDDSQSLTSEVIQTPSNEYKTSQSEDLTHSKSTNTFRPR